MNTALSLFWMLLTVSLVVGGIKTVIGVCSAPMGYEDETGFHFANAQANGRREASAIPFESGISA